MLAAPDEARSPICEDYAMPMFRFRRVFGPVALLAFAVSGAPQRPSEGRLAIGLASWEFASDPSVILGGETSHAEGVLHIVADAVRLSDGRILVANGGLSSRLPVFSAEGQYLSSLGREGDGPGEFHWITHLEAGPNDSIFIFDAALQRLTVFQEDGRVVRTARFASAGGADGRTLLSIARLAGGRTWFGRGTPRNLRGPPDIILRDTIPIGFLNDSLTNFRLLGRIPGRMMTSNVVGGLRGFRPPAFTPRMLHAVWGRCVFVSAGDEPSISVFGADGRLISTFDGPGAPRPVTDHDIASREDALFEIAPQHEKPIVRRRFRAEVKTEFLPLYAAMIADEWGQIWVQEYSPPWGPGRRWYVLSQSGERLSDVEISKALTVFSISEEGLLGSARGALGETVEFFPLKSRPSTMAEPLTACAA